MRVSFNYTNHHGKNDQRHVEVLGFVIQPDTATYYPGQFTVNAIDLDKDAHRTFALANISNWQEQE